MIEKFFSPVYMSLKLNTSRSLCSCFRFYFLFCFLTITLLFHAEQGLWAQETLTEGELTIKGLQLSVPETPVVVPVGTPAAVETTFSVETDNLLKGITIKAELRGPGLSKPLPMTTLPNHPFSIPAFSVKGDYYLENIRLERNGDTLLKSDPNSVLIRVMDIVVTSITSKPLTLEEIREKGINITDESFTVFHFSVGIMVESTPVTYEFPVVYTDKGPYIPTTGSGGSSTSGGGFGGAGQAIPFSLNTPNDIPEIQVDGNVGTEEGTKLTGFLIFKNDIAFLNQFFSVMFIVTNNAPDGSTIALKNLEATMTFPDGLIEAETTPPHIMGTPIPVRCPGPDEKLGTADDLNIILATFSGMAEFLAEGKKTGNHIVKVDFSGTMTGLSTEDVPVEGTATGMVVVKHPSFSVTFSHPDVIRTGEFYDIYVTLTNTSAITANLVSLTMPASRLIGCDLHSDERVAFETLEPGESETATFHMLSRRTGKVRATAFQAEGDVSGVFVLTAGVGEEGIPLSPDTLVLPSYAYSLSNDIINPAMLLLGEAYSIATTPPGGLPHHLPLVTKQTVENRIVRLAEAGQRVLLRDTEIHSLQVLTLDWLGNEDKDLPFDTLRRLTSKGKKWAEALTEFFITELETTTVPDFQTDFIETCYYKAPFISAVISFNDGDRCAQLGMTDFYQNRLTAETTQTDTGPQTIYTREIPFGELYTLSDANDKPVDFILVGSVDIMGYTAEVSGQQTGTFDLSLTVPGSDGILNRVVFEDVSCQEGGRYWVSFKGGDSSFALEMDTDGDGTTDSSINGTVTPIPEPPLQLLGAVQDCRTDNAGRVTALLFNKPLDKPTATTKSNFMVPGKNIYASFLQPSQRVILVGMDSPVSPFVESTIRAENLTDTRGNVMTPVEMDIITTIKTPGGVISGKVMTVEGLPVANARVRLEEDDGGERLDYSFTRTDTDGNYQFDFVRILSMPFTIDAVNTGTGKNERVSGRLQVNGQRLTMDIFMRGRGGISGRVTGENGEPRAAVVLASAENAADNEIFQTKCDEYGRFILEGIPLGTVNLSAGYIGDWGMESVVLTEAGEVENVTIGLQARVSGAVEGHVLRYDGTPVSGTLALLYRDSVPLNYVEYTDENGYFFFEKSGVGTLTVKIMHPDTGKFVLKNVERVGTETARTTIVFRGNAGISGRVLDHTGGNVTDATVYVVGTAHYCETNAEGEFAIANVPIGNYMLEAVSRTVPGKSSVQVYLDREGETVDTTLSFPEPPVLGAVRGVVYGADNTLLTDTDVWICNDAKRVIAAVKTNTIGEFQADNLPPGHYKAVVYLDDQAGVGNAIIGADGTPGETELHLKPKGRIVARVITGDDVPPGGESTAVMADVSFRYQTFRLVQGSAIGFQSASTTITTGTDGYAVIDEAFYGNYTIKAENPFYPGGALAGGVLDQPEINVQLPMPLTGTLKITVNDETGQPMPSTAFLVNFSSGSVHFEDEPKTTDSTGVFYIDMVPQGGFYLETIDQVSGYMGNRSGEVSGGGETETTVRLKGKARVTVTVNSAQGVPVENVDVTLRHNGFPQQTAADKTGADGTFTFEGIWEGDFSVEAYHNATMVGGREVGVISASGADTSVTVTLAGWGAVTGKVLAPGGTEPVTNARVEFYASGADYPTWYDTTGDDGVYLFDYVPLQSFVIKVTLPSSDRTGSVSGTLTSQQTLNLDVTLESRGEVSGVFYDGSGSVPIPGALVTLTMKNREPRQTDTDANGTFQFSEVPKGTFDLRANKLDLIHYGSVSGEVVYEGEQVAVDILSRAMGTVKGIVRAADGSTPFPLANVTLTSPSLAEPVHTQANAADTSNPGGFSFANVPVNSITVTVSDTNGYYSGEVSGVLTHHGQVLDLGNVVFDGRGTVTGTVTNPDGTAVPGIEVTLISGTFEKTILSNQSVPVGGFEFTYVPLGAFQVSVREDGSWRGAMAEGELAANGDSASVSLVLDQCGEVSGSVLKSSETGNIAAAGAYVTLTGTGTTPYTTMAVTNVDGTFLFERLRPGPFDYEILGTAGTGRARGSGTVAEGGTALLLNVLLDNEPPVVSETIPLNAQVNVAVGSTVTVRFSEAMDTALLNNTNIHLYTGGNPVTGTVAAAENNTAVVFTPAQQLLNYAIYNIQVDGAVTDIHGNRLGNAVLSSFSTADTEKPQVSTATPAIDATGVSLSTLLEIVFSEPMDLQTINGSNVTLIRVTAGGNETVDCELTMSGGRTLHIGPPGGRTEPEPWLQSDSHYRISLTTAVTDAAGNALNTAYSSDFFTLDTVAPILSTLQKVGDPSVVEGDNLTVEAVTGDTDVAMVHFFLQGEEIAAVPATAGQTTFNLDLTAPMVTECGGSFLVQALAVDTAGNLGNKIDLDIPLTQDQEPPVVSITAPIAGGEYRYREMVDLQVSASDNYGLAALELYVGEATEPVQVLEGPELNTPPFAMSYTVGLVDTDAVTPLRVVARDQAGYYTESTVDVLLKAYIDTDAPDVTMVSPITGGLVMPGEQLTIRAAAEDQPDQYLKQVEFFLGTDTTPIAVVSEGDVVEPGLYEFVYTVPADAVDGTLFDLKAVAVDVRDNRSADAVSSLTAKAGVQLTDGTHITATDSQYDGETLYITNGTVTIDGEHTFADIVVRSGAVLTHSACTLDTAPVMKLLAGAGSGGRIIIENGGRIDVDGKGYLGAFCGGNNSQYGRTYPNTNDGASGYYSGGSYGGHGGKHHATHLGGIYGNPAEPFCHGSGGGTYDVGRKSSSGGGVIWLETDTLVNNGIISSNGPASPSPGEYSSAGSGGSVYISVQTLGGTGRITADGGNTTECYRAGAGGGGRIAVYYNTLDGFNIDEITTYGGESPIYTTTDGKLVTTYNGNAGTVYLKKFGEMARMIVDNRGLLTDNYHLFPPLEAPQEFIRIGINQLENTSATFIEDSLKGMTLTVMVNDELKTFTVTGNGLTTVTTDANDGDLPEGTHNYNSKWSINADLEIRDTRCYIDGEVELANLMLSDSAVLSHSDCTMTSAPFLKIISTGGTVVIGENARIDVDGRGYLGAFCGDNNSQYGRTYPNTNAGASGQYCGGSYGGHGGKQPQYHLGGIYGNPEEPFCHGSGGGTFDVGRKSSSGGGVIWLEADTLVNNGIISSNGPVSPSPGEYSSAGSGGSVYISVQTLGGTGRITADGGSTEDCSGGGAGGGGRIAVYYDTLDNFEIGNITAYGGIEENSTIYNGNAGTVYLKKTNEPARMIVDNRGLLTENCHLFPPLKAPQEFTRIGVNQLENTSATFIEDSLKGMTLTVMVNDELKTFTVTGNGLTTVTTDANDGDLPEGTNNYAGKWTYDARLEIRDTFAYMDGEVELPDLTLSGSAVLSHSSCTTTSAPILKVIATGSIEIGENARIDVDGRGYLGGYNGDNQAKTGFTYDNTADGGSDEYNGGSYGGYGGPHHTGNRAEVYGALYEPVYHGSGGGGSSITLKSTSGGGVIWLKTPSLINNGVVTANSPANVYNAFSTAGSGGSVFIDVGTLSGSGTISANGGSNSVGTGGGAGGGGRIAIYYDTGNSLSITNISCTGGGFRPDEVHAYNAGAGTIYIKGPDENNIIKEKLRIDNAGTISDSDLYTTRLPGVGQSTYTKQGDFTITIASAAFHKANALQGMKLNLTPDGGTAVQLNIIGNSETEIFLDPGGPPVPGSINDTGTCYGVYQFNYVTIAGKAKVITDSEVIATETNGLQVDADAELSHKGNQ